MNYRIKFFSSFCNSKNCKEVIERLCETQLMNNYGENKEIYITTDDDYTHAIILNTAMPLLNIPKENVIGLAFEPSYYLNITNMFVSYAKQYIGKYFIGNKNNLPEPFIEHYGFMWYCTPSKSLSVKTKLMSIIFSNKLVAPGHKYRLSLINEILRLNLPIDIYGTGCNSKLFKPQQQLYTNIKGKFNELEPYTDYMFHISIENFKENDYASEKFTNSLMNGCTPIYFGCNNIDKYFPNKVITLSGNIDNDIKLIIDILKEPNKYIKQINLEEVKNKIYILRNLEYLFQLNNVNSI